MSSNYQKKIQKNHEKFVPVVVRWDLTTDTPRNEIPQLQFLCIKCLMDGEKINGNMQVHANYVV